MTEEARDTAGVIVLPPVIYAGPLLVGLLLQRLRPVVIVPRAVARVLGPPLIMAGVAVGGATVAALRRAGTPPDPREPTMVIVVRGPYRVTHNPSYLSFTLLYAGVSVRANALWTVALLPGVLLVLRRGVIDREERYLKRRFGDEYRQD